MKLQDILNTLPKLKPLELQAIRVRVEALTRSVSKVPELPSSDWITPAIAEVLIKRGHFMRRETLPRNIRKDYNEVVISAQDFLLKGCGCELSSLERRGLAKVAVEALIDYVQHWSGFGPSLVLNSLHLLPAAMDQAFPGYAASQRLSMLIPHKKARKPRV